MDEFELEMKTTFLEEARALLEDTEGAFLELEAASQSESGDFRASVEKIFRLAHNFKGSASAVGFAELATLAHRMEDILSAIRQDKLKPTGTIVSVLLQALDQLKAFVVGLKGNLDYQQDNSAILDRLQAALSPPAQQTLAIDEALPIPNSPRAAPQSPQSEDESIRVSTRKLDQLLNRVGELVVNQSILDNHRKQGSHASEHAIQTAAYMEKLVGELQDISMSLRMVPIRPLFSKMNRIVRDVARDQEKEVILITEGDHVEIDKVVLDRMADPLTHLIRNAVDHGIETAEVRTKAGKPAQATVVLQAAHVDDQIVITVMDDGKGLDAHQLRKKGIEKGLISEADTLSDEDAYNLIFRAGFSTKEQITNISGRGVGLDVVMQAVTDLKGTIETKTKLGEGTGFVISLPLSLSIIPGLVVRIDSQQSVLPVSQLTEIIETTKFKLHTSTGTGRMLSLRGEVIPVLCLGKALGRSQQRRTEEDRKAGVITTLRGRKFCFAIDEIIGQQQIVIKKLGTEIEGLSGVLGGAILSNGDPSLILDLRELVPDVPAHRGAHVAA